MPANDEIPHRDIKPSIKLDANLKMPNATHSPNVNTVKTQTTQQKISESTWHDPTNLPAGAGI